MNILRRRKSFPPGISLVIGSPILAQKPKVVLPLISKGGGEDTMLHRSHLFYILSFAKTFSHNRNSSYQMMALSCAFSYSLIVTIVNFFFGCFVTKNSFTLTVPVMTPRWIVLVVETQSSKVVHPEPA